MGQKVNPIGFRLGVNRTWDSRWFADGPTYARLLHQDLKLRTWLKDRLRAAGVSRIIIERPHKKCRVTIYAARPGVVIGRKGADIETLRKDISGRTEGEVHLNIVEVRKPETDAQLIAETIAQQLERRIAFRRAMKRSMQAAMRLGAKGVRINVSGRLGGAEIARMEWYREGRVPLHTLRADIDYGFIQAKTTHGIIGVKVWVFKGEVLAHDPMAADKRWAQEAAASPRLQGADGRTGRPPARQDQHRGPTAMRIAPPVNDADDTQPVLTAAQTDAALIEVLDQVAGRRPVAPGTIATLLRVTRHAMELGLEIKPLAYRVPAILPALLDRLSSEDDQVRWAAAYAIAAIREPKVFAAELPQPRTALVKPVLDEIRKFLHRIGVSLYSAVDDFAVRRDGDRFVVTGRVHVTAALPYRIAGALVGATLPEWARRRPAALTVVAENSSGQSLGHGHVENPEGLSPSHPLSCPFEFVAPDGDAGKVIVTLLVNGHWLGERRLTLSDLKAFAARE